MKWQLLNRYKQAKLLLVAVTQEVVEAATLAYFTMVVIYTRKMFTKLAPG
jgi:hypothetical protein